MKRLETKYGTIYIEELDKREEDDRVKIYDSNMNYLDYLPLWDDDLIECNEENQYQDFIDKLKSFDTVEGLLEWLVCEYEIIATANEMVAYIVKEWGISNDEANAELESNEYINKVGDKYILLWAM